MKHDQALARMASGLEDWLTGRQGLQATRGLLTAVRADLRAPLSLPRPLAARIGQAEDGLLQAVTAFTSENAPDAEGQRALFGKLNKLTRDRAVAVLEWRGSNNQKLRTGQGKSQARSRYLAWEAGWLPLWKAEVDLTYRLQAHVLSGSKEPGKGFVRELLALQARAGAVPTTPDLSGLQELAVRRLTLLARTAEQLDRLGRGESRGALTRVRRLNKEQTELGKQLQDQRMSTLSALAK